MDFGWKGIWKGYLNPYRSQRCPACDGSGYNPETKAIADAWYDHAGFGSRWGYDYYTAPDGSPASRRPWRIRGDCRRWLHDLTQDEVDALVEEGQLHDLTHAFIPGQGWQPKDPPYHPTAAEVNEWSRHGMGHDAINEHTCVEVRAKRLGVWGHCAQCGGEGEIWASEEVKAQADAWEDYEPPTGPGWQLWETTSEGSPQSPVFATPEDLASWCAENATLFACVTASREKWLEMIQREDGVDVGSMMMFVTQAP
jgi:hypothetical protein